MSEDVFNLLAIRGSTLGEGMTGIAPRSSDPQSSPQPLCHSSGRLLETENSDVFLCEGMWSHPVCKILTTNSVWIHKWPYRLLMFVVNCISHHTCIYHYNIICSPKWQEVDQSPLAEIVMFIHIASCNKFINQQVQEGIWKSYPSIKDFATSATLESSSCHWESKILNRWIVFPLPSCNCVKKSMNL